MNLTILHMCILLHYATSPEQWEHDHANTPASAEATKFWLSCGCLEPYSRHESGVFITAKGKAMVEQWLRQPLPRLAFVDADGQILAELE